MLRASPAARATGVLGGSSASRSRVPLELARSSTWSEPIQMQAGVLTRRKRILELDIARVGTADHDRAPGRQGNRYEGVDGDDQHGEPIPFRITLKGAGLDEGRVGIHSAAGGAIRVRVPERRTDRTWTLAPPDRPPQDRPPEASTHARGEPRVIRSDSGCARRWWNNSRLKRPWAVARASRRRLAAHIVQAAAQSEPAARTPLAKTALSDRGISASSKVARHLR